ncbi:hypothetical protein CTAYLR_006390 [Chrysophaeum taylorii]|uniref:Chitin-binding type-4 domain-containing protein n=1 Tax=Chrysophaeum taylorii TaxID=2483200 RepID=A0AAD7U6N6_9STRA|nr:hypothetical protein CTAYLR_006390 [Chrysophaeum taylorii]
MFSLVVILFASRVAGHGYLFEPKSRQRQALDARSDWCPHCVLAAPMLADVPGSETRSWPGNQAFAEPGTAPSVGYLMNGVTPFGVCGTQKQGTNDYNYPDPDGEWGTTIVGTYKAGEAFEVSWCANADHGGVYSYRLCNDPSIIAKLLADEPMSSEEQEEAEECFQRTVLRCDDADGNDCSIQPDCRADWGCAADPGKYFHCGLGSGHACAAPDADACESGRLVKDKVVIPVEWPEGPTVLTWRWDSHKTTEVFAACADIYVEEGEFQPTATPTTPRPSTSAKPTVAATAEPTKKPTEKSGGRCCWWSSAIDWCAEGACPNASEDENGCAASEEDCLRCSSAATFCPHGGASSGTPAPTPRPTPAPTPRPTRSPTPAPTPRPTGYLTPEPTNARVVAGPDADPHCCFLGECGACAAPVFADYHCGESASECAACAGTYCD